MRCAFERFTSWLRQRDRRGSVRADGNGVRFSGAGRAASFRWVEVEEIRTFKRDYGTTDEIRLAFRVADAWHEFGEEDGGFTELTEVMRRRFPTIAED